MRQILTRTPPTGLIELSRAEQVLDTHRPTAATPGPDDLVVVPERLLPLVAPCGTRVGHRRLSRELPRDDTYLS